METQISIQIKAIISLSSIILLFLILYGIKIYITKKLWWKPLHSYNVDYANKSFNIYGEFYQKQYEYFYFGCFYFLRRENINCSGDVNHSGTRIAFNYTLNGMPTSNQETRPKTKFFSLLIYAGYPIL